MPNIEVASRKSAKLDSDNAHAANATATAADTEAIAKPPPRPIRRISIVAGTVVAADAMTNIDIGSVAHAGLLVNDMPMIPPSDTKTIEPVAEINWQKIRMIRLRFGIDRIMRKMSDDVIISGEIAIPLAEIEFSAVRSQGAGGQNVNKVASAIHLRFDIVGSASLPAHIRDRLLQLGDRRVTAEGVLVIKAQEHRTQERNRRAAVSRLRELIQSAAAEQKPRVATKPSKRSKVQRIDAKRRRGQVKKSRGRLDDES
jgi:ribosome-associated protein